MGAVADHGVGAGVNGLMGEIAGEIRNLFHLRAVLGRQGAAAAHGVTMVGYHHPIGLAARFADPFEVVGEVGLVCLRLDAKGIAQFEPVAEKLISASLPPSPASFSLKNMLRLRTTSWSKPSCWLIFRSCVKAASSTV